MDNSEKNNNSEEINESNAARRLRVLGDVSPEDDTPVPKTPFFTNFWYHYKWVTIFVLFFVAVGVSLVIQLATKEHTDLHVMYAGPYVFEDDSVNSAINALKSLEFGGTGDYNADILRFCCYSDEKQEELKKSAEESDSSYVFNVSFNESEFEAFENEMMAGSSVICLLDATIYDDVKENNAFLTLDEIYAGNVPDSVKAAEFDDCAVLLSETKFGRFQTAFASLPDDTVIAIRSNTVIGSERIPSDSFNKHIEYFKALLAFEYPEGYTDVTGN